MKFKCVFIYKRYFEENKHFIEMLDQDNSLKQANRKYIFLEFKYRGNNLLVPLRSVIPDISKLGQVGYRVSTEGKPNAGLDYRKVLIVNDESYIEEQEYIKIPKSQLKIIEKNYSSIEKQVIAYVDGYIKSVKKNRHLQDRKFCYSTLHNFHEDLKIIARSEREVAVTEVKKDVTEVIQEAIKKAEDYNNEQVKKNNKNKNKEISI